MGVCALTGKEGKFIKCHLYPQSFYSPPEDKAPFKAIGKGKPPKTSWTGLYDSALVTTDGEAILALLDDYAAKVLLPRASAGEFFKTSDEVQLSGRGDHVSFAIFRNLDVEKLILFFSSIMWRFGASSREEAAGTTLGPYLEILHNAVLDSKVPDPNLIGISILRITDAEGSFAFTPARHRVEGVSMWQLVFGNYQVNFRCDRRAPPFPYRMMEMRVGEPLVVMAYEFARSRSFDNVARMVRSSSQKYGRPWGNRW